MYICMIKVQNLHGVISFIAMEGLIGEQIKEAIVEHGEEICHAWF